MVAGAGFEPATRGFAKVLFHLIAHDLKQYGNTRESSLGGVV